MAESSADFGGGITYAESQQYHDRQQQMDRLSEGSGATEDGDGDVDYTTKGGDDDGRYPEKAQLEEAGYRYESALRSCGHGKAQWQVHSHVQPALGHFWLFSRLTCACFKLFAALAIGLAADSIEQFVIGFILPSTQQELCLNEERSAWLGKFKLELDDKFVP